MLKDSIRMACYRRAIQDTVKPDSVVLDLGAGSGILSFFAARAGAKKIYAIEKRTDMVRIAQAISKDNGFSDLITFIENSSHLVKPESMDPKPNILVAEILGNAILEEHILEFTIDARERLLAPGAKLIPGAMDIMMAAFDSGPEVDKNQEICELEGIYGFNFNVLKTVLNNKPSMRLDRFSPLIFTMMSKPFCAVHVDFHTITSPILHSEFEFEATKDGFINGFCAYFNAHMSPGNILTNSPWAPPTHWTQIIYHFPTRREVKTGEKIAMELHYDGGLSLWFKD
jgi:SAM-dependent methyltransferase